MIHCIMVEMYENPFHIAVTLEHVSVGYSITLQVL